MSVLVKGMEIPNSCTHCDSIGLNVAIGCPVMRGEPGRATDCPLCEVKTPHGRLVDANELSANMYHDAFETDSDFQRWDSGCWVRYKLFEMNLNGASTVIEAEGEDDVPM